MHEISQLGWAISQLIRSKSTCQIILIIQYPSDDCEIYASSNELCDEQAVYFQVLNESETIFHP